MNESIFHIRLRTPALFYGIILLCGTLFSLQTALAVVPFLLLLRKENLFASVALFLVPLAICYQFFFFPPSGSEVEGIFTIETIRKSERYSGGWSYQGKLKTEKGFIPCRCFAKNLHSAGRKYQIKGTVRELRNKQYQLKAQGPWHQLKAQGLWQERASHWNLGDLRYRAQEAVKGYIERNIPQPRAAHFLTGMITGQLEDRVMQKEFSQLGLSHLMAISGLHFSLIALALHLILRLFLPSKLESLFLMAGLTAYFLFVGPTPSVLRAWIMAMAFLLGLLIERRCSAQNGLGVALCLALLIDPLSALTLSFQLSYLATAGILFFYAPCDLWLQKWIPKERLSHILPRHWLWQQGYIYVSLLREGLALTSAVHITLLPLLLFTFHQFPLSGLLYNLFFPLCASFALLFFIASLFLGPWAHLLNGLYCDTLLRLTESPPIALKTIHISSMAPWLLAAFLTAIMLLAIGIEKKKRSDRFGVADNPLSNHF